MPSHLLKEIPKKCINKIIREKACKILRRLQIPEIGEYSYSPFKEEDYPNLPKYVI